MGTLESTAKMIASQAEKQKVQNTVLGNDKAITCEGITNINKEDYPSCEITFEDNTAKVTIIGGGKFEGLNICGGTKTSAEATKEECKLTSPVLNCTFDGELSKGKEFINGQYTYRYKQAYKLNMSTMVTGWEDIDQDGWGVILTNKSSTDPVNTPICSYINGKPLVSTSMMFVEVDMSNGILNATKTTNIDVSNWDTDNVTNMMGMFFESSVNKIDLSGKDMRNVTNMSSIFSNNANLVLDLSNTNLNGLTDISNMFNGSILKTLNMSGANLSNVTNMSQMFKKSSIGTINMSNVNARKVTNITDIFDESEIINLDMSGANLSNVTDMFRMFATFGAALFLKEGNVKSNVNLSEMDVRNVKSIQHMFGHYEK